MPNDAVLQAAAPRLGRGRAGTVPRPGGHGDLQRRDQSRRAEIGPRAAGARDHTARLPQAVGRHGGTGRHLDHDHRFSRRAGTGPLTPGVTYEFWLVGHNFRGDGPESNRVTHAVPVGP